MGIKTFDLDEWNVIPINTSLVGSLSPFLTERTNILFILINYGSFLQSKLFTFSYVVISDLYLFQKTVLWNPSFKCCKNVMLSFIEKVTTGT